MTEPSTPVDFNALDESVRAMRELRDASLSEYAAAKADLRERLLDPQTRGAAVLEIADQIAARAIDQLFELVDNEIEAMDGDYDGLRPDAVEPELREQFDEEFEALVYSRIRANLED